MDLTVVTEEWLGAPARSYRPRPATILDVLDDAVAPVGCPGAGVSDAGFVLPDGAAVPYPVFAEHVEGASAALAAAGLRPGDAVALAAENSLAAAVAHFAAARAGVVLVGLPVKLAPVQWTYLMERAGARVALGRPAYLDALRAAAPGGVSVEDAALLTADRRPWAYDPAADRPAQDATFALVATSGTTGRPKASRLVHRCSVHSGMSYAALLDLRAGERTLVSFPLSYISALHAHVLPALLTGATCVLTAFPPPREFVAVLARERVSWAYAVPAFWQMVLRTPGFDHTALPALERVGMGGSAFPPGMEAALRQRLPGVRLYDVYGLSETHSPATMLRDHEFAAKAGSIGRPLPCMEARVVDDAGTVLDAEDPGELHLRGSLVTTGYEGEPEATAAAIRDGWFATGDIARIDADGYVWILDRVKDMVNRGGAKVFSAEVERVLRELPEVADAGVVGAADRLGGEVVVAFVVPARGATGAATVDAGAVRRHVTDQIADHAAPRWVHVVDELPRNASGKTDKPALRAEAARRANR